MTYIDFINNHKPYTIGKFDFSTQKITDLPQDTFDALCSALSNSKKSQVIIFNNSAVGKLETRNVDNLFKALSKCKGLEELWLCHNFLKQDHIEALMSYEWKETKLKRIDLRGNSHKTAIQIRDKMVFWAISMGIDIYTDSLNLIASEYRQIVRSFNLSGFAASASYAHIPIGIVGNIFQFCAGSPILMTKRDSSKLRSSIARTHNDSQQISKISHGSKGP